MQVVHVWVCATVCVCVCLCACTCVHVLYVLDWEESRMVCVSDWLQWLTDWFPWTTFTTLWLSHQFEKCLAQSLNEAQMCACVLQTEMVVSSPTTNHYCQQQMKSAQPALMTVILPKLLRYETSSTVQSDGFSVFQEAPFCLSAIWYVCWYWMWSAVWWCAFYGS